MHPIYWFTFLGALALGCAENIGKDGSESDTGSHMDNVTNVGGTTTTTIDATDEEAWVYLDFESASLATVTSPETDLDWDIGLRRYHVKINGGVSGSGDMALSIVSGGDFDAITAAPADGYITDEPDNDPTHSEFRCEPGLTTVKIHDFDHTAFINLEADIHYTEDGDGKQVTQVENFGIHFSKVGTVVYGLTVQCIGASVTEDGLSADLLCRVLADVHEDSSKLVDSLLSSY